ncbi:MAG: phospho-sugar mutase [Tenacibaculum sp.]
MTNIIAKAKEWLSESFDIKTRKEVQNLLDSNHGDLFDCFYKDLAFGTGGIRGIVGVGTNRINKYTIGKTTQGLANYLKKTLPNKQLKVAIGFDCRCDSPRLAELSATVLSANNIEVFLFEDLRPTPELSFAVSYLHCNAGIVLTASHNPPQYNGYKVYGPDGGQIVPPSDKKIIKEVNALSYSDINFKAKDNLIHKLGREIDEAFWKASLKNGTFNVKGRENLKIVFTSLHGTSIKLIPEVLKRAGYTQVHIVKEQAVPDGNFPTVKSPNPEEPEALQIAVNLADKVKADIVLATDPDSDRIGIAVRNLNGNTKLLNGNQSMSLMTDFLLSNWKKQKRLNGNQFIGSTVVSTELVREIASSYKVETKVGLTGFKWIAKMIKDHPDKEFIGGGEESFGYMVGDFVRDKDAVTAALLACEIAADAKSKGSSFYKELLRLYTEHHFYKEHLVSLTKKGKEGTQQIEQIMCDLRNKPFLEIDREKVCFIYDYQSSIKKNLITGKEQALDIPKSNVLIYQTVNGTRLAARPSGTEPKIKFYFSVKLKLNSINEAEEVENKLNLKIKRIVDELF